MYFTNTYNLPTLINRSIKTGVSGYVRCWEQVLIDHACRNYNLEHVHEAADSHYVINRSLYYAAAYYAAATSKLSDFSLQYCPCLTTEQS